jgi:hypothetical protein
MGDNEFTSPLSLSISSSKELVEHELRRSLPLSVTEGVEWSESQSVTPDFMDTSPLSNDLWRRSFVEREKDDPKQRGLLGGVASTVKLGEVPRGRLFTAA